MHKNAHRGLLVAWLALFALFVWTKPGATRPIQREVSTPLYSYRCEVVRVIDGDSIVVDIDMGMKVWKKDEHLRLLDIDTPEIRGEEKPQGLISKQFVVDWIAARKDVIYIQTLKAGKFGRWLTYIWERPEDIGSPEKSLNYLLLEKGLAERYDD